MCDSKQTYRGDVRIEGYVPSPTTVVASGTDIDGRDPPEKRKPKWEVIGTEGAGRVTD